MVYLTKDVLVPSNCVTKILIQTEQRDYIGVSENVFAIMEDGKKGEIYKYIENVSSLYKLIYFVSETCFM